MADLPSEPTELLFHGLEEEEGNQADTNAFNFSIDHFDGSMPSFFNSVEDLSSMEQNLNIGWLNMLDMELPRLEEGFEGQGVVPPQGQIIDSGFGSILEWPQEPLMPISNAPFDDDGVQHNISVAEDEFLTQGTSRIRDPVQAQLQAAADPSSASTKEKRMDTGIAAHPQGLGNADTNYTGLPLDPRIGSSLSPRYSGFEPGGVPHDGPPLSGFPASSYPTPRSVSSSMAALDAPSAQPVSGGVEMVLDLNMNARAFLPKKQKARTKAQRENYINVRRNGACEKHRKRHKKCDCLEKASARFDNSSKVSKNSRAMSRNRQYDSNNRFLLPGEDGMTMRLPTLQETEDSVTTRYTCLWPGCTYFSTTLPLLEKHYSEHTSQAHERGSPKDRNLSERRHSVPASRYGQEKDSRVNHPVPSPERRKSLGFSTDLERPQTLTVVQTTSPAPRLTSGTATALLEAKELFRREPLTLQSRVGVASGQNDSTNTLTANLYFNRMAILQQKGIGSGSAGSGTTQ